MTDRTLHSLLIDVHAAAGVAAFALGFIVLRPHSTLLPRTFRAYLGTLWMMVSFLIVAVVVDWGSIGMARRVLYGGLSTLALYVGRRGWQAHGERVEGAPDQSQYIEDVGFTLIALFDGFVIVGALDLGAPVWLVVTVGALGIFLGRLGVRRVKRETCDRRANTAPLYRGGKDEM